ncbi:LysR family transcriptional regulator [Shewanella avicenniae]|uniref:LysR family transcriptional regulator n=1 Tax=Shewanella avicenniae TaxID=2814294 RepID=A0ABX7QUM5_9GAMM|nr:LysR family transcriptional regulator [Shewanella avicenniae]QSX35192.1 LysR family transcriptional regulator [Shewanella avicenniae]
MDRIDVLRAFVMVASENSFTKAADRLQISPQLVSKYVSRLEETVGIRLVNRTTRKVHLTEAGLRYFQRAQQLLDDFDDLEHQLSDLQDDARGLLRISAPVSFSTAHMARLLTDFRKAYPHVDVDLQLNDRKVDIVEEGFDIALRIGNLKSSSLIAKHLAPIRLVMCASPAYLAEFGTPTTAEALQQHQFLSYSYMERNPLWPEGHDALISNNGDVLVQAAIAGAGITLQPTFIAGDALADGRLVIVLPELAPEPLGLFAVYPHRKLLASKVRSFLDFADGYFGNPPYWDANLV